MSFKKLSIAVAVASALGMAGQTNAHSDPQAVGQAILNITDLIFSTTQSVNPTPPPPAITVPRRTLTPADFTEFELFGHVEEPIEFERR